MTRIDSLTPTAQKQWGKMEVAQMLAHCSGGLEMASGRINPPRAFIGRLLGPIVRPIYTNEKPFSKNSPTLKMLVFADARHFEREKEHLKVKIQQIHEGGEAQCTRHPHPFFGSFTPQEWNRDMD